MTSSIAQEAAQNKPQARKTRLCPDCGAEFVPASYQQTFCSKEHKVAFQNRAAQEGRAIIALAKAWRASRNSKDASARGAACLSELSAILDGFNAQDREAGRPSPLQYAGTLLNDPRGKYMDRQRRR